MTFKLRHFRAIHVSEVFLRMQIVSATDALQRIAKMTAFSMFNPSDPESAQNDEIVSEARSFFCDLYGRPDYASLDKLRAHLFASSRRDLRSLPQTEDSFRFHVLRSLSQIFLYKQATLCNPILLPLEKYGWYVENERLLPIMKEKPSKPATAKLTFYKYKNVPKQG